MTYFAGLDVSVKETSVCIVDDVGKIVQEARVASEPEALLQVLTNTIYRFKRVGLEAGPLSQWLYSVLADDDDVCRRLMTIPGVGPVVALTYRVTVDVPARFRNSKAVGAVFGLVPILRLSDLRLPNRGGRWT